MRQSDLLDALVLERKIYNQLNEVFDLSQQLAEAADRGDPVAVQMLVGMRQEPINLIDEANRGLKRQLESLPEEDSARLKALLDGAAPLGGEEERLCAQVAVNQKLLKKTVELDRRISGKIAGGSSVYAGA